MNRPADVLKRLKGRGYDVRVKHLRPTRSFAFGMRTKGELDFLRREIPGAGAVEFEPTGGETVAVISRGGEALSIGRAVCCDLDNFDRHRGLQIALGRAVKQLWPKGLTTA